MSIWGELWLFLLMVGVFDIGDELKKKRQGIK